MKQNRINLLLAVLLILAAALSKVVTFPHTYSPIIGMALFAGAVIKDKKLAFILPLLAMLLSDIIFEVSGIAQGFYGMGQIVNYGVLALITLFGFRLKKINAKNIFGFSIISSVIFFVLSNLSFFFIDNRTYGLYSNDLNGLFNCFVAALPFFKAHIDLAFSAILFGSYFLITHYFTNHKTVTA